MNSYGSKIVAVLLLTAMATVSVAGQEISLMVATTPPASGCHQHGSKEHGAKQHGSKERGSKPPASAPVSYRCCQVGHNSAILQSSVSSQPSLEKEVLQSDSTTAAAVISAHDSFRSLAISSPDPPHSIPLRV